MTENRKSVWGFIWTIFWFVVHLAIFICGVSAMLGYEAVINGMVLSRNMKNGYLISGLIAGGSGIVLAELLLLMTREHYLDQQAYLKLLPIFIGGAFIGGGEYLLEKALSYGKIKFPMGWILYLIIYLCYLFIDAFRPWRSIKMLAGVNA